MPSTSSALEVDEIHRSWSVCHRASSGCGSALTTTSAALINIAIGSSSVRCGHCGKAADFRTELLWHLENDYKGFFAFPALGAKTTTKRMTISPLQRIAVSRSELGIPESALLLDVSATPSGSNVELITFPHILLTQRLTTKVSLDEFLLVGAPFPQHASTARPTEFILSASWIRGDHWGSATLPWLTAVEAYAHDRTEDQLLYAQIAIEQRLVEALHAAQVRFGLGNRFGKTIDRAGIAVRLEQVQTILRMSGEPPIGDDVMQDVDRARTARNRLAHGTGERQRLDRSSAAHLLLSSSALIALLSLKTRTWLASAKVS